MTSMELLELLGSVRDSYVLETFHNSTPAVKRLSPKRVLLVAAIAALSLLLVGCTVAYVNGWFTDYFAARSEEPLSPGQVEFIQEHEQIIQETQVKGDWTVELKSAICDGETGYILFGITAPEDVELEGRTALASDEPYITPGNHSWGRNSHRALIVASTGLFDDEQNFMWQQSDYWQDDNDGLANTMNYCIEISCQKVHSDRDMLLENPFGPDVTFTITFDDFTLEYEDPDVRKKIDEKYAGMTDYMVDEEDLVGLHKSEILAEGEWTFDIAFNTVSSESVELITGEPVKTWGIVTWKLDNEPLFYKTGNGMGVATITSFVLNPFGATLTYEYEEPAINIYISYQDHFGFEDRYVYAVMKDGSKIAFQSQSVADKLEAETPIVLSEVDHILLGDGVQIPMPG